MTNSIQTLPLNINGRKIMWRGLHRFTLQIGEETVTSWEGDSLFFTLADAPYRPTIEAINDVFQSVYQPDDLRLPVIGRDMRLTVPDYVSVKPDGAERGRRSFYIRPDDIFAVDIMTGMVRCITRERETNKG